MNRNSTLFLVLFVWSGNLEPSALKLVEEHRYFQTEKGEKYWALSSYYIPQYTESSCSLATATMLFNAQNALRGHPVHPLLSERTLASYFPRWGALTQEGGDGLCLEQFANYLEKLFQRYGCPEAHVQIVHLDQESPDAIQTFRRALQQFTRDKNIWIAVNFQQKEIFDMEDGCGHIAPVAAYDETRDLVLLMDSDRKNLEPYWVPLPLLLKAMLTQDPESGQFRGYVVLKIVL